MKIKALALMGALLALGFIAKKTFAGEPVFMQGIAESNYSIVNSTVAVAANNPTTVAAAPNYRSLTISNPLGSGTTIYARADSSVAVSTVGIPIYSGESLTLETNNPIYLQRHGATQSTDVRLMDKQK